MSDGFIMTSEEDDSSLPLPLPFGLWQPIFICNGIANQVNFYCILNHPIAIFAISLYNNGEI